MTPLIKKRPVAITVIGWFCILVSLWELGRDIYGILDLWNGAPPSGTGTSNPLMTDAAAFNSRFGPALLVMKTILDGGQVIAGAYLLRLRAWARTVLETILWTEILLLAIAPMVRAIYIACFTNMMDEFQSFKTPMLGFLALLCAWVCLLDGLIIYFLRSKKVRDAVAPPRPGTT